MTRTALRLGGIAAVVAVGITALAGCGAASSPDESGGDGKVTLTFANADPAETWAKAIEGFQKANPDITVKQLNIPYAQYTSTINQRMAGGGGDIDLMVVDAGGAVADWATRGFLADISDLKDAATKAAVSEDMVTSREYKGKLYALETWTTSQFLYYNADVLKKAGIEPPSSDPTKPWTYEQLTAAAQKIKDAGAAEYPFLFDQWDSYYQLQMVGRSAGGGDGIDADGKVDFDNPGWQKALSWYHGLFESGLSPRGITNDKNGALFQTGKAGFIVSGPWGVSVAEAGKVAYGVAPAPYFEGGEKATSTDSWAVAVSAKSKKQDAAKKFLEYLTIDPEGNAKSAEVAGITPTNKEAYAAYAEKMSAVGGEATARFGEILQYQLENNAVHRPAVLGYSVFEPGAGQMFSDIRNGSDPMDRAKQADKDIAEQISRLK
ncbi:sugar ABC transporter substrate-binding protein [Microbacterium sp.]|uniref:sugar ABC transporter substrate-binding protein n=1 Tax=Microbacterium sp. TaxID=51671 RepID=UPI00333EE3EA